MTLWPGRTRDPQEKILCDAGRWVHTGHMGNTFTLNGFSMGSSLVCLGKSGGLMGIAFDKIAKRIRPRTQRAK